MLFNSYTFLLGFLPVTLLAFFAIARWNVRVAAAWLGLASLVFYGWWNPKYVVLLLASIAFNFAIGKTVARGTDLGSVRRRAWLAFGVAVNLVVLGFYKYADFFIGSANATLGSSFPLLHIILPLGISFFTFTQIAFLVDAARGEANEFDPVRYLLFVTYYPHLIAGPVLHHKEMMPQFGEPRVFGFNPGYVAIGLTVFAIGLFKKVVLADGVAPFVGPVFAAAERGETLDVLRAWGGALAYTLQLYFDFSGYSDMAIGLSYLIGVRLPLNFNSPYKARNIADFWRRWHMTLSRFLRDYLYIPLGGNRRGPTRRVVNLMTTMLLGGLWHGAGWTFVVWGGLHGAYLVVHQLWSARFLASPEPSRWTRAWSLSLTLLAVIVAWVFFRASTFHGAATMLHAMAGGNGIALPSLVGRIEPIASALGSLGVRFAGGAGDFVQTWAWIVALFPIVLFAPNSQEIMATAHPALAGEGKPRPLHARFVWTPTLRWSLLVSLVLACGVLSLTRPSEFLYFQF